VEKTREPVVYSGVRIADARSQKLILQLGTEELLIHADAARMRQVVENLLTNASKYTAEGGTIGVEVRRAEGEAIARGPRLVALTGYGRAEDRRAVRRAGFNEHLVKPVSRDVLRSLLQGT
jgi:signal transduction histidine kinase